MALISADFRKEFPMVFHMQISSSLWDIKISLPHLPPSCSPKDCHMLGN